MEKIGFIGYGNMGKVLINAFIRSKALRPDEIIISTRTKSKLLELKDKYPGLEIAQDNRTTASRSRLLFLFVGTADVKKVMEEINEFTSNIHIIYISAALTMKNVEEVFDGKITKVMPTLTSEVFEGISLICHNAAVDEENSKLVNKLFNAISDVKIVEEEDFIVGTDITSCSPAFIAKIFMEFVRVASDQGRFTTEETEEMVLTTLYATSKLLYKTDMGFEKLISTVATKGGITEEGLSVLESGMPHIFAKLFSKTIKKNEIIQTNIEE